MKKFDVSMLKKTQKLSERLLMFFILLFSTPIVHAQIEDEVIDMKDPITGKWGYASKVQNRKSPLKGIKKLAVNSFGNAGSNLLSKEDADAIDWVIPPLYDAVSPSFSEHLAGVEVGGRVGFIDIYNRFIIEPQFEPVKNLAGFNHGMAAVKVGEKFGYINMKGELVIDPVFDDADNFKDNWLATVKKDGKYGAIDFKGEVVVPCKYAVEAAMTTVPISNKLYRNASDSVQEAVKNLAYSDVIQKLQACEDEVGKRIADSLWIQPLVTSEIGTGDNKGIKDNYNRMIIPARFSNIDYDEENHLYVVSNAAKRYGVYTYNGCRLFHPLFDSISPFQNGISVVTVDSIEGTIDRTGWIDPSFMDDICNTGLEYDTNGNVVKASTLYRRILTIDPNHVMALNNLAIIDINNKDYNKGLKKLKLANKLAPDNELISENLHIAKKNRNNRRWNRITTGLEIAATVITLGATAYAIANGSTASASGMTSAASDLDAGGDMGGTSSSSSGGKVGGNTSSKASYANWSALDRAYGGYEDQLIRMKDSGNYDKQEVRNIQNKMKDIRAKILKQSGGSHQRAASPMESWNP